MSEKTKEIVFSKQVVEFAAVAKEYCAFIENLTNFKRSQFIQVASSLLPLLYYKASLLPATEPIYEDGNQKHVTEEYYLELNVRLKAFLGEHDAFPEVFDPRLAETDDEFSASLAEYLSDVYQDLKDFTIIYQGGQVEEMNDALWECRLNFQDYWGIRLANAIRAIHQLAYGEANLDASNEEDALNQDEQVDTSNWFMTRRQQDMEND
ncbi:MAG: DUF5063 domain-containing protein [Perlabentimonas sp.]